MGFFLLLVYLAMLYIRPFDFFPSLAPYRILFWLGISATVGSVFGLAVGERPTFRGLQIYLMLGFMFAMGMSHVTKGWFGGGLWALENFASTAMMFFLLILNVTSLRRLRIVAATLVLLSLVLVVEGTLGYHYGWLGDRFVLNQLLERPVQEPGVDGSSEGPLETGRPALKRIRSLGVLNDPNDLAQALIVVLPFIWLAWQPGRRLKNAVLVVVPSLVLVYGLYLTHSRGGVVGLLVLVLLAARDRLSRTRAVFMTGLLAVLLLAIGFAGGRGFSLRDDSMHGRLDAWGEGLQMVKSNPLFGVGYRSFSDFNELTAHNSFVLCFAELGLTGYFFWLGLLSVTILEVRSVGKSPEDEPLDDDLRKWGRAIRQALYTFLIAAWFLSRTYIVTLYLLVGLGSALVDIARRGGKPILRLSPMRWAARVGALECGTIMLVYILVRLRFM